MQKNHDQVYWEKIGETYGAFWKSRAKQEMNKKEIQFINKYLLQTKSLSVLDIGVGAGRIIENYLANPKVKKIYGVDWAKSMVDYCRNKFKNNKRVAEIKTCNISREQLPFNIKYDFISAIRVLKYNENWPEITGNLINALNSRGIFIFTIPNKNSFLRFTTPETAIYNTTKNELENLVKKHQGKILHITAFGKLPDVFYDISNNGLYVLIILSLEDLLRKCFGDILFGREFFIAVGRK